MAKIWFWQMIVSPHMAWLAEELARRGHKVGYVAEREMCVQRSAMGWQAPRLSRVDLNIVQNAQEFARVAAEIPPGGTHILQGVRGNGPIRLAEQVLADRGEVLWAVLETVDDPGLRGLLKRLAYSRRLRAFDRSGGSILAIGHATGDWLIRQGFPADRIASFAYFLPTPMFVSDYDDTQKRPYRICFAGALIPRKRVSELIEAVAGLDGAHAPIELWVIGDGPLADQLRQSAVLELGINVRWFGTVPQADVPRLLAEADVLVLPSRHDGWGAVVSEALIAGIPAICSDRCGVAGVVRASGVGGVYAAGNVSELRALLAASMEAGPPCQLSRAKLRNWAKSCLSASAGAAYLEAVIEARAHGKSLPAPPWFTVVKSLPDE